MPIDKIRKLGRFGLIVPLLWLIPLALAVPLAGFNPFLVQAATIADDLKDSPQPANRPPQQGSCYCSSDIYECYNFSTKEEAQACLDYCKSVGFGDVHGLDIDNDNLACESLPSNPLTTLNPTSTPYAEPQLNDPVFRSLYNANNLITNGSFELGGYGVPELGFEPPETGFMPEGWRWFKGQAYGKYNIYLNDSFGIVCPEDLKNFYGSDYALSLHMQSTDQPDARLGIYQTISATPGQSYLLAISGTIQAQPGASSPDINNRVTYYVDPTGSTDWTAIPNEKWIPLPWKEQELEFKLSGPDDPDLAKVEGYYNIVKAKSDKMTLFIQAWRRWPNWRTTIFSIDCAALAPLNQIDVGAVLPALSGISTTAVDAALKESGGTAAVAPAAAQSTAPQTVVVPAAQPPAVPAAGGILDTKNNWVIITLASILVISGLVGAGFWNARRHKD